MMKLSACEKLLRSIPHDEQLRVITAHLLLLCFFQMEEYERVLRYLEQSTEANNHFKDVFELLLARSSVSHSIASNALHVLALRAECNLLLGRFEQAAHTFN
jgi:tetratricopeptide (TPR) repeat protein